MNSKLATKIGAIAVSAALAASVLGACTTTTATTATTAQQDNRNYMSQVNQKMQDLDTSLDAFVDAVSRQDVVNMKTQADNAFKSIDELNDITAPDELSDVQKGYADGTAQLKQALSDYIQLYTEIQSATSDSPFDWSTYDQRVSTIQGEYDAGVQALQAADEAAASKN